MYEIFEELLLKFNISAYKFSKDTGIPQSTISTWKRNRNLISSEIGKIISEYFGISYDYLMTGKEMDGGESYYLNDETKEIAQAIFENKELRMLFDVSRKASPDHLKAYYNLIKSMHDAENKTD